MFLTRADGRPLSIRVGGLDHDPLDPVGQNNFVQFLASVVDRAWSIIWDTYSTSINDTDLCSRALSTILKCCNPGTLTHFSIILETDSRPFIDDAALMEQPEAIVEILWLPVTTLNLNDFYPKWTSKLYHGLTELHLGGVWCIPESALVAILESSPGLRILEINIDLEETTPPHLPVTPVLLEDLEVFKVAENEPDNYLALMRIIQPGPKPLTLSITNLPEFNSDTELSGRDIVEEFFARSNVTKLTIHEMDDYTGLLTLLTLASTVRVLALVQLECYSTVKDGEFLPTVSTLEALYVTRTRTHRCYIPTWHWIEHLIQRYSIPKLCIWNYPSDGGDIPDNFYTVCPQVIVFPDQEPDPVEEWV